MTVGMSHDCLHLIGSDRILSLCHLFLPDVTVSVADPGLSVGEGGGGGGGGRIKRRVQKGVGAGGGNAPSRFMLGGMGERCKLPYWGLGRSPRSF